jgi:hypothetical protein
MLLEDSQDDMRQYFGLQKAILISLISILYGYLQSIRAKDISKVQIKASPPQTL